MQRILVIEDENDIRQLLRFNLEREGFAVLEAADGLGGLHMATSELPDLVVLDLMLPGMDGCDVCRRLKAQPVTAAIPVLMLTARGEEVDRIVGLTLGADDYVVKPFSVRELVLRIRAILRRGSRPGMGTALCRGALLLDVEAHRVTLDGQEVALTATEFRDLADVLQAAKTSCGMRAPCVPVNSCSTRSGDIRSKATPVRWTRMSGVCGPNWVKKPPRSRPCAASVTV